MAIAAAEQRKTAMGYASGAAAADIRPSLARILADAAASPMSVTPPAAPETRPAATPCPSAAAAPESGPARRAGQSHSVRLALAVLIENSAIGLTRDFHAAMTIARVRDAGLPAAGDRGALACAAGAVLLV